MPTVSSSLAIDSTPAAIWRVVIALGEWPGWSPLVQDVRFDDPAQGLQGEWQLNGLLGRVPYNGSFRLIEHEPLQRFVFSSIRLSPPYEFIRHDLQLNQSEPDPLLSWTITYSMSRGPGGWIVDRLLIRRQLRALVATGLTALAIQVHG